MKHRLTVAFLWHMHQPSYADLGEGRASMPWVRLHALKEYYALPALARRFPTVRQTFNLVPCLIDQLEGYAEGRLTDPILEVASRPARDLTREDRLFLLREFFAYNPATMGTQLPRLDELRRKRGARAPDSVGDAALAAWRETDYRDLQVLFHLAWSGNELSARPEVARLIKKGRGYSQDDLVRLLETQREFIGEVLPEYAAAAAEGTIEISASPYYHPILPLLCDTACGAEAVPGLPLPAPPFRHPEDARLQIRMGRERFARRFGSLPAGMWPSEGAVSNQALALLAEEGVRWAASDEDILFASLVTPPPQTPGERSRILHRPYVVKGGTSMFFRDHTLSDRIGFVYQTWDPEAAASDFVGFLHAIADMAGAEPRVVPVILDGENPWEYYPGSGAPFLTALLRRIAASDRIEARTFSSVLDDGPVPVHMGPVRAGSWISADLTTWIGDPEKNRAWQLLSETRAALGAPAPGTPAGESLLAAEGSDWFWWYGHGHTSAHDEEFDRTFRLHLRNAYRLSGRQAPLVLDTPIIRAHGRRIFTPPTGPVTPTIDGRAGDYFEWLAAGRVEADLGSGTMSRGSRILRTLRFGAGERAFAVRLDTFAQPASSALSGLAVTLEFGAPTETRVRIPLEKGPFSAMGVAGCLDRILELSIPFSLIHASRGSRIEFRLVLEDSAGKELEAMPDDGLVSFTAGGEETDWIV